MPNNADMLGMLNNMEQINSLLAATGTALPANWGTMLPNDKMNFLTQLSQQAEKAGQTAKVIDENAMQQKQMVTELGQSGVMNNVAPVTMVPASVKKFNLKKAQFAPPMPQTQPQPQQPVPQPQPQQDQQSQQQQFRDGADLKDWLDSVGNATTAIAAIAKQYTNANQVVTDPSTHSSEEALGVIKDAVNAFFSTNDEQQKLAAASALFDTILPDSAKSQEPAQTGITSTLQQGVKPNIAKIVEETNKLIKKLAEGTKVKKAATVFNLKTAQHATIQNVMTFGPGQTKIDAFTGQLISDWHLVERNKGFGLKIDDVLNIDFEAIWRGNIMDKFYSPYRDKDGNWVGGYIENRFEVDKNIPPLNNLQLKPGEKRRPYVPEYSLTEARLESSRKDMNKERGYTPSENGKIFNWKEASKKKVSIKLAASPEDIAMENVAAGTPSLDAKVVTGGADNDETKTAQTQGLQGLKPLKLPGEKSLNTTPTEKCPICKGDVVKGAVQCPNCSANIKMREMGKVKTGPDQPGQQSMPTPSLPYNARLSSVMSAADAIFYDGTHFIVYANRQKERFDTFEEAEAFKVAQIAVPSTNAPVTQPPIAPVFVPPAKRMPVKRNPPKPVDIEKQRQRHESAHGLAIDG